MDRSVSGVVLSYGRTANIPRIVAGMLEQPWMDDVVVWHNPGYMDPPVIDDERVKVCESRQMDGFIDVCSEQSDNHVESIPNYVPFNAFTWGRFQAAYYCNHHTIATVDDDNLPRNWQAIYDNYQAHPEVITASIRTPGHMRLDAKLRWGNCHEVLLGWGSMFCRHWISAAFSKYTQRHGKDEVFHRKADRLFSMLLNRHHNVIPADFEELPGALDNRVALGVRKDHGRLTIEARHRAFEILGITQ